MLSFHSIKIQLARYCKSQTTDFVDKRNIADGMKMDEMSVRCEGKNKNSQTGTIYILQLWDSIETSIQDKYTVSGSEHWEKKKDPATPYVTFDISCNRFYSS